MPVKDEHDYLIEEYINMYKEYAKRKSAKQYEIMIKSNRNHFDSIAKAVKYFARFYRVCFDSYAQYLSAASDGVFKSLDRLNDFDFSTGNNYGSYSRIYIFRALIDSIKDSNEHSNKNNPNEILNIIKDEHVSTQEFKELKKALKASFHELRKSYKGSKRCLRLLYHNVYEDKDTIASIYGVSRQTIWRWTNKCQETILQILKKYDLDASDIRKILNK
jgi:hypothetical protein